MSDRCRKVAVSGGLTVLIYLIVNFAFFTIVKNREIKGPTSFPGFSPAGPTEREAGRREPLE